VRGNARLRRRLDEAKKELVSKRFHLAMLVTLLDANGLGDHEVTRKAAWSIGWYRAKR
jgi:hypothetical protein